MRTILFRGREIKTGKLVFGSLIYHSDKVVCIVDYAVYSENSYDWHEVDPKTVGQFTGLKDKSGKKIFEGDEIQVNTVIEIQENFLLEPPIEVEQEIKCLVVFRDNLASFDLETLEEDVHLKHWGFCTDDCEELEVVGNIHDKK